MKNKKTYEEEVFGTWILNVKDIHKHRLDESATLFVPLIKITQILFSQFKAMTTKVSCFTCHSLLVLQCTEATMCTNPRSHYLRDKDVILGIKFNVKF